ncbi:caspase family protein [Paraburkholderia madseniana]|nr:caspase family protein [Paraburkholderia madseniana]
MLPPPAEVRAIIVGIESYPGLGASFDAPGAASGALAFASWLVQRGVPKDAIELWLSSRDGSEIREICATAGLESVMAHEFRWSEFRHRYAEPRGMFSNGRFLMVYFCGHGVISGPEHKQYLVLPEATEQQFHCFETQNWLRLFTSFGWENYGHQLWIIDACRSNEWGPSMKPVRNEWNPGDGSSIHRCALFACAEGESAALNSKYGPRFTKELLATLADTPTHEWPAFDEALRATAKRLRDDPNSRQRPTYSFNEDWFGHPLLGPDFARPRLEDVLSGIPWSLERFMPYVNRSLPMIHIPAGPLDLQTALALLRDLRPVDGVPPLLDFAERVARASCSEALRTWIESQVTPQQSAQLDARLATDSCRARLALWYRDDGPQSCIEAELDVIDAGGGVRPWPRMPAKAVTEQTVHAVFGEWLQAVYDHVGNLDVELIIELYLPRSMLTAAAYDTAIIPLANDELRLGEDQPTLLHCTDRYKARAKRMRWYKRAPEILDRLVGHAADPLLWALPGEDATELLNLFTSGAATAPVWLGFDPHARRDETPLDVAITEGLPAVLWVRAQATDEIIAMLKAELRDLLKLGTDELPNRLAHWRERQCSDACRTVAFLLDDPKQRLPAIWTQWSQPKG